MAQYLKHKRSSAVIDGTLVDTATVTDNIATFTARTFSAGDIIRVDGALSNDTLTVS